MKYQIDLKEVRVYEIQNSCIFKKNNEEFGGLSNMATIYPLKVNGISIKTSEALYQACRFPHLPEIQKKIIEEKSPMTVKMISNSNKRRSRDDWEIVRLKVMRWCVNVKLAQNFISFGKLLHQTGLKNIVENSAKDNFWGAIPNEDGTVFTGKNALGRLLMDLRKTFYSEDRYSLLYVEPIQINDFLLYGESIRPIDERQNFMNWLNNYWRLNLSMNPQEDKNSRVQTSNVLNSEETIVQEDANVYTKKSTRKSTKKNTSKTKSKESTNSPDLFSGLT